MTKKVSTKIIGILNITPDSFSDGGLYINYKRAIDKTYSLINEGANIVDIGAESTRPNAQQITNDEEFNRLKDILPEIIKICKSNNVLTSIDSYKIKIIKFAIDNGIDIINDQTGVDTNEKASIIAKNKKIVIIMHSITIPTNRNVNIPDDVDVIMYLRNWIEKKIQSLEKFNIYTNKIIFDPGLGFGKTFTQCFEIIKRIQEFESIVVKICIGHSRKGFLGGIGNKDQMTLALSTLLIQKKVDFIRVHDVKSHKEIINNFFH